MAQPRRGGNAPMQDGGLFGDPMNRRDLFDAPERETAQAADEGPAEAAPDRPAAPPPPADFATARDPLRKPGDWQAGTLLAENPDGTTEEVPAGEAVRSLMARYKLAQRLMECLDANP